MDYVHRCPYFQVSALTGFTKQFMNSALQSTLFVLYFFLTVFIMLCKHMLHKQHVVYLIANSIIFLLLISIPLVGWQLF